MRLLEIVKYEPYSRNTRASAQRGASLPKMSYVSVKVSQKVSSRFGTHTIIFTVQVDKANK